MTVTAPISPTRSDYAAIAARAFNDATRGAQPLRTSEAAPPVTINDIVNLLKLVTNPLEEGGLLRMLDKLTGGRTGSSAALSEGGTPPKYDASSLYGTHGPRLSDVQQTNFGDCYFAATLGAMANERPSDIRNAISYDAATQSFNVRLYDSSGTAQTYNVTQAEIDSNIAQGGGSRRDDGITNAAIWPDVMEVAYAKQLDSNHADGLTEGYTDLANGGWPKDAMRAITGSEGTELRFDQGARESRAHAMDEVGNGIRDALRADKPVTAWSVPETSGADGLRDDHVYTVTRAFKDANGNWQVTMRNPWNTNSNILNNDGTLESKGKNGAFITVPLDTLVRTGGLNSFRIGN